MTVDGKDVAPWQRPQDRLWLPLPGGAGVRYISFSWVYAEGVESLERPSLDQPQFEGTPACPALWTLCVPPGLRVDRYSAGGSGVTRTGRPDMWLRRADAQLRLSTILAAHIRNSGDMPAVQFAAAQKRLYRYCNEAEQSMAQSTNPSTGLEAWFPDGGAWFPNHAPAEGAVPGGPSSADWLEKLKEENRQLADRYALEKTRADAEREALDDVPIA